MSEHPDFIRRVKDQLTKQLVKTVGLYAVCVTCLILSDRTPHVEQPLHDMLFAGAIYAMAFLTGYHWRKGDHNKEVAEMSKAFDVVCNQCGARDQIHFEPARVKKTDSDIGPEAGQEP